LLRVSVTSNNHQADISVHGHYMFSAYITFVMYLVTDTCFFEYIEFFQGV